MRVFDEDSARDVIAEEKAYHDWLFSDEVKKKKKKIKKIGNRSERQAKWSELFLYRYTQDDSFLESKSGVW